MPDAVAGDAPGEALLETYEMDFAPHGVRRGSDVDCTGPGYLQPIPAFIDGCGRSANDDIDGLGGSESYSAGPCFIG